MPRSRRRLERPIPPGTCAGVFGKKGATTSAHQEAGVEMMNGRLGRKNAASIKPTFVPRLRILVWGFSCQRRMSRKGATTIAICFAATARPNDAQLAFGRSEEHTSELQSQSNLVCRLLLEKK